MIFKKLIMTNFRQFRGTQEILFQVPSVKDDRNVTVIYGGNGLGKTGIFRAAMFALYGEYRLSQDDEIQRSEIHLVNRPAVLEHSQAQEYAECSVHLDFEHMSTDYSITRTIRGLYDSNQFIEEPGDVSLWIQEPDGNSKKFNNAGEIRNLVNQVLHESIREYFLFDGEKIERLTRATSAQRKEISRGFRQLLNIDSLEIAIGATGLLHKELDRQLQKESTGEFHQTLIKLNKLSDQEDLSNQKLQELDSELELAVEEKREIDGKFQQIKELLIQLQVRRDLEFELGGLEEQARNKLLQMKTLTGKSSIPLIHPIIRPVFDYVDEAKEKGEIPSEIRRDLIDKILEEKLCICGRPIDECHEAYREIIKWRDKIPALEIEDTMLNLWSSLHSCITNGYDRKETAEFALTDYAVTKNHIEKIRSQLAQINFDIGDSGRDDATHLEELRQQADDNIRKLTGLRAVELQQNKSIKTDLEKLRRLRTELEKKEEFKNELSERSQLAYETQRALKQVYEEFSTEIKNKISKDATDFFSQLIDSKGREVLKKIVVDQDYSLQILDRFDRPFLADISAGQRQIMSISFIAALAKAACGDRFLEIPFFMDTPLGRLSLEHRESLLKHLPNFTNQLVLLVTDTEFTRFEAITLMRTARWGRFYKLDSNLPNETSLVYMTPEESISLLPQSEEVNHVDGRKYKG